MHNLRKMAEKSSVKGKNRVLRFLVKSSFPQNAQKKPDFFCIFKPNYVGNLKSVSILNIPVSEYSVPSEAAQTKTFDLVKNATK